jgi:hypothetical protein
MSAHEALHIGIIHEIRGITPPCRLDWVMQMRADPANHPARYLTENYLAACRAAATLGL